MNGGQNGLILPLTSSMFFLRLLQQVSVWYASQQINFSDIHTLIFIFQVFAPANVIFAGIGVLLSVCILFVGFPVGRFYAYIYQAAKDARASQDILIDIFERIEMFFRRLEIYTELPSTMEMMDTIIQVMAEVLSILGIATKEIRQGRMSKYLLYKYEKVD
jgi:hypothetical protein